jgi:REP element-mobilizing transposase RayT
MSHNSSIHQRHGIRLKGYDYSQNGWYFITICCHGKICRFGRIENGRMVLNEYGKIAYDEWLKTSNMRPNIQLDEFIVMPNHIHGIIGITDNVGDGNDGNDGDGNGNDDRRGVLHTPCDHISVSNGSSGGNEGNTGVCNTPLRSPSNTIGAIIRGYKSAVTKQMHELGFCDAIWQRNYYEHIIRNEQSHQTISDYIICNSERWQDDKFYCDPPT